MAETIQKSGPRVLRYRAQVHWAGVMAKWMSLIYGAIVLLMGASVVGISFVSAPSSTVRADLPVLLIISAVLLMPAVFFLLQYWLMLKPMMNVEYRVLEDRVWAQQGDKTTDIFFDEIREVRSHALWSYNGLGGWFTFELKDGRRFRFSLLLERAEYILDGLQRRRPDLLEDYEFKRLRQRVIMTDHALARLHDLQRFHRGGYVLFLFGLPFFASLVLWALQSRQLVIYSAFSHVRHALLMFFLVAFIVGWIGVGVVNFLANRRLREQLEREPGNKRRDTVFELSWLKSLLPAQVLAFAVVTAVVWKLDLNTLGLYTAMVDVPGLRIQSGDTIWVDGRYNCFDCSYSLGKGDLVKIDRSPFHALGVIVALPGETTLINKLEWDRPIGIADSVKLEAGEIAVQLVERRPANVLIAPRDITGLVFREFPSRQKRPSPYSIPQLSALTRPTFGPEVVRGCGYETLNAINATLSKAVAATPKKYASLYRDETVKAYEAAATDLQSKPGLCPGVADALAFASGLAGSRKNLSERYWVLRFAFDGLMSRSSEALRLRTPASAKSSN